MYPLWQFLHGVLLAAGTGALVAVLALSRARSRAAASVALLLVAGVLVAVPLEIGALLALGSYGPDFAQQYLPLGVPLALVPLVAAAAMPTLSRAATGDPDPAPVATLAARVALVSQLLGWHLLLVPPASRTWILLTGLVYAALLAGTAALSFPPLRSRRAAPRARPGGPGRANGRPAARPDPAPPAGPSPRR